MVEPIDRLESNVRNYARQFPTVFKSALGSRMTDEEGREYIDFFSGAGSVNYGHNYPQVNQALVSYIQSNGIQSSLDMTTSARHLADFSISLSDSLINRALSSMYSICKSLNRFL